MDPPYHQRSTSPVAFTNKFSIARIDVARLQRTSKRVQHSTGGRSNPIVNLAACDSVSFGGSTL
jgi:hypothetical protein